MKKVIVFVAILAVAAASTVAMAAETAQTAAPAQQVETWPSATLNVTGAQSTETAVAAQAALLNISGVKKAEINTATNQVTIWYDAAIASPEQIAESFTKAQTQFQASVAQSQPATVN